MTPLSAIDSIGPAFARTRLMLFRNFRLGRFLKLTFVAILAASGGGYSFNFPSNFKAPSESSPQVAAAMAVILSLVVVIFMVAFVVGLVLFYVSSRLKFALFYSIATADPRIGPGWSRSGSATWRLIGITLLLGFAFAVLLFLAALPFIFYFVRHRNPTPALHQVFGILLFAVPIFLLLLLLVAIAMIVIRDFMVPAMALENATIRHSWIVARAIIESSPGQVALFILLRFGLGIAMSMFALMALFLAALISAIPMVAVGFAVYLPLRHSGPLGHMMLISLAVVGVILALCWLILLYIGIIGASLFVLEAYSIYFVGSRYRPLGDLLEPPFYPPGFYPPPFTAPPAYPPPPSAGWNPAAI